MIYQCHFQSGQHRSESNKQGGKKQHTEKKTSPMANTMTPVHVVSIVTYAHTDYLYFAVNQAQCMPQVCLERMPQIFHSKGRKQEAIKKIWKLIQDSLCVRIYYYTETFIGNPFDAVLHI